MIYSTNLTSSVTSSHDNKLPPAAEGATAGTTPVPSAPTAEPLQTVDRNHSPCRYTLITRRILPPFTSRTPTLLCPILHINSSNKREVEQRRLLTLFRFKLSHSLLPRPQGSPVPITFGASLTTLGSGLLRSPQICAQFRLLGLQTMSVFQGQFHDNPYSYLILRSGNMFHLTLIYFRVSNYPFSLPANSGIK